MGLRGTRYFVYVNASVSLGSSPEALRLIILRESRKEHLEHVRYDVDDESDSAEPDARGVSSLIGIDVGAEAKKE